MIYYLNDAGSDELAVMAVLRNTFHMSLGEARDLISACPAALPEIDGPDAQALLERLRSFGASVAAAPTAASRPASAPAPASKPVFDVISDATTKPVFDVMSDAATKPVFDEMYNAATEETPAPLAAETLGGDTSVFVQPAKAKLAMVKLVKEFFGIRLAQAKDIVDNFPDTPITMSADTARRFVRTMSDSGFTAIISKGKATSSATKPAAPAAISSIEIKAPGSKGLQIILLLKNELKLKYSAAAAYASSGGTIDSFPSPEAAARVAEELKKLGAEIVVR